MVPSYVPTTLGVLSSVALGLVQAQSVPVAVVPTVSLVAIITGSIAMGMLYNRVRQLERRMDKVQRRVFHEDMEP